MSPIWSTAQAPPRCLPRLERTASRTIDGLEILIAQGALSLELWTGRGAPLEVMLAAARAGRGLSAARRSGTPPSERPTRSRPGGAWTAGAGSGVRPPRAARESESSTRAKANAEPPEPDLDAIFELDGEERRRGRGRQARR